MLTADCIPYTSITRSMHCTALLSRKVRDGGFFTKFILTQPLGIHWEYIGNTLKIHWEYIGNTLGIHWEYIGNTLGIHW